MGNISIIIDAANTLTKENGEDDVALYWPNILNKSKLAEEVFQKRAKKAMISEEKDRMQGGIHDFSSLIENNERPNLKDFI